MKKLWNIYILFGVLLLAAMIALVLKSHSNLEVKATEKKKFAREHESCSAFYLVLDSILKGNKNTQSSTEQFKTEINLHTKMALILSSEKADQVQKEIEEEMNGFKNLLITEQNEKVKDIVDKQMGHCIELNFRTEELIRNWLPTDKN